MRKTTIVVVTLLCLLASLGWATWNLDDYLTRNKNMISARIADELGHPIHFESVGVSLRGGLAIALEDLRVGSNEPRLATGGGTEDLLHVPALRMVVKLLPAFLGRVEVREIILEQPTLTVVRTAEGLNIAALGGDSKAARSGKSETPEKSSVGSTPNPLALALLRVEGATVHWIDRTRTPQATLTIHDLDFATHDRAEDRPVQFELRGALFSATPNADIRGTVGPATAVGTEDPNRRGLPLRIRGKLTDARVEELLASLRAAGILDSPLEGSGSFDVRFETEGTTSDLTIRSTAMATDADLVWPGVMTKPPGEPLVMDATIRNATGTDVRIEDTIVRAGPLESSIEGTVTAGKRGGSDLRVSITPFAVAGLGRFVPALEKTVLSGLAGASLRVVTAKSRKPELHGSITLERAGIELPGVPPIAGVTATITIDGRKAALPDTSLLVGSTSLHISATIADLLDPTVAFSVTAPEIHATALGIETNASAEPFAFRDVSLSGTVRLAADAPIRARAQIRTGDGSLGQIPVTTLSAKGRLEAGRVIFNPLTAAVFAGALTIEGVYDPTKTGSAGFNFKAHARDLSLSRILRPIAVAEPPIDGVLAGDFSLAGTSGPWPRVRNSLVGGGSMTVRDGVLRDVNLTEAVLAGLTGIPGLSDLLSPQLSRKYPGLFTTGGTRFRELRSRFTVAEGAIISDDIILGADDFTVSGRGELGLDGWVDVRATLEASETLTKDLVDSVSAVRLLAAGTNRMAIPFRLRGRPPKLSVKPDTAFVRRRVERALLESVAKDILGGAGSTQPDDTGKQAATATDDTSGGQGRTGSPPVKPPPISTAPEGTPLPVGEQILRGLESLLNR